MNKKNMPSLSKLILGIYKSNLVHNFFDVDFIKHLADEEFVFQHLFILLPNIQATVMEEIVRLNFSKMEDFSLKLAAVTPESI